MVTFTEKIMKRKMRRRWKAGRKKKPFKWMCLHM
jgi:hypothetical protein